MENEQREVGTMEKKNSLSLPLPLLQTTEMELKHLICFVDGIPPPPPFLKKSFHLRSAWCLSAFFLSPLSFSPSSWLPFLFHGGKRRCFLLLLSPLSTVGHETCE